MWGEAMSLGGNSPPHPALSPQAGRGFESDSERVQAMTLAPLPVDFPLAPPAARTLAGLGLALRPVACDDGGTLQAYIRALSPSSRYNRFFGGLSELPPSELAKVLASNGRDAQTLLLVSQASEGKRIVGEVRMALSCEDRAGEFALSIADDWQGQGVGSALIEEIERRAAAVGIERLVGDVLGTNRAMIGLARARGFAFGPGLEGRLVRIEKRLAAAPDLPCRKWAEIAAGADARMA